MRGQVDHLSNVGGRLTFYQMWGGLTNYQNEGTGRLIMNFISVSRQKINYCNIQANVSYDI